MKITSKSPGRHLVKLQEKLIQIEKEKIYIFFSFYIFPHSNVQSSASQFGRRINHLNPLISSCSQNTPF